MRRFQTVLCIIGFAAAFGLAVSTTQVLAQAQTAGPTLLPAEYKPLPMGTKARYTNQQFVVESSKGFKVKVWDSLNNNWFTIYAVFGREGDKQYHTSGAIRTWETDLDPKALAAFESMWPLEIGKKAEARVDSRHPDGTILEWTIRLEVVGTDYVELKGRNYATYVVKEVRSVPRNWYGDPMEFHVTSWYSPDAGLILDYTSERTKGGGRGGGPGTTWQYKLLEVTYPKGTTDFALKPVNIDPGVDKALLVEVEKLRQKAEAAKKAEAARAVELERVKWETEKKYQAEIARIQQENQTAMRALQSAKQPTGNNPPGGTMDGVDFGTYHALVIGNQDYEHLSDLKTPVNDAKAVSEILTKDYGFKVKTLINATRDDINDALDNYRDVLRYSDNLLIYYAGHGWMDDDTGRGYWLPVDARKNRRSRWISNATITDTLKGLLAKHAMVVADSCYSGTLLRGGAIKVSASKYWRKMVHKRARVVLTSGGLEPVADKGGGGHSPFAKAFIDTLKDNQAVMDGTTLFSKMRRPVMVNAEQTPEYSDVRNAGHDGGDFLFVKKF